MDEKKLKVAPKNHVQEGKPRPTLLPMDVLIKHVTPAYEEGVLKYERESWRMGFPVSTMIDAAERHISQFFWDGEDWDKDAAKLGVQKHHLAGAIFCLLAILHTLETRPELDDRIIKQEQVRDELRSDRPDTAQSAEESSKAS